MSNTQEYTTTIDTFMYVKFKTRLIATSLGSRSHRPKGQEKKFKLRSLHRPTSLDRQVVGASHGSEQPEASTIKFEETRVAWFGIFRYEKSNIYLAERMPMAKVIPSNIACMFIHTRGPAPTLIRPTDWAHGCQECPAEIVPRPCIPFFPNEESRQKRIRQLLCQSHRTSNSKPH